MAETIDPIAELELRFSCKTSMVFYAAYLYAGHDEAAACARAEWEDYQHAYQKDGRDAAYDQCSEVVKDFAIDMGCGKIPQPVIEQILQLLHKKARKKA